MPLYDYTCNKCGKRFSMVILLSELSKTKVACPKCKSASVHKEIEPFFAVTSKKS